MRYSLTGSIRPDQVSGIVLQMVGKPPERGLEIWVAREQETGQPVGLCGFQKQDCGRGREWGLSIRLKQEFWKRGLATEACRGCLDYAFRTAGLPQVIALVDPYNTASIRMLERLEMTLEGPVWYEGIEVLRYSLPNPGPRSPQ